MGFVKYFVAVLMLSAQLVLNSPTTLMLCTMGDRTCKSCSAGEYQKSCTECEPCPAGHYTTRQNCEDSCLLCYGDCRSEFHLKVVQNCSSTSDVKCTCEAGFTCVEKVRYTENCKECVKIQVTITTGAAVISGKGKQTTSSASSGHSSISPKLCRFPECGPQPVLTADNSTHHKPEETSSQLAAILGPMIAIGLLALMILFCVRGTGDEMCFRQIIAKLCYEEGQATSHVSEESTHQIPRDSFSAKQQPSSQSAASLGPVHVHNQGTVIFSLLSQFTGQVGSTVEGGKTAEKMSSKEDERSCPVFHPTSPHSIHLSEEEKHGGIDSIFFPSQEQGKDCHVSKEEAL
ncbi:uncharacterized protein [Brachyistius frenatus]|uniref:uncharacterized protein n=1 Tax=Brachyistius frenatus TaxID=100188 RepID=UPI0037E7DDB0